MNPVVKSILIELHHRKNPKTVSTDIKGKQVHLVFGNADGGIMNIHHLYRDFQRAQNRAKMSQVIRFHDLRHTFASHFMMNGGNIYDLQKVLGHTKTEMTQIYAHLAPEHLAGVTSVVNFGATFSKKVAQIQPNEISDEDNVEVFAMKSQA
jgi:site-specific recombinase XerD